MNKEWLQRQRFIDKLGMTKKEIQKSSFLFI
jgi:hypothetical protein